MDAFLNAELEQAKYDALAEFAAGAGHEINNPLAVISGRAQLLLASESDESRQVELSRIIAQARRAHEMLADLWLIGRPPELCPEPMDLRDLLDRFATEFTASLQRESAFDSAIRTISLLWRRPGILSREPILTIDADALMVALHAVGRNAVEAILRGHTESSRSVELRLIEEPERLCICVTDHGDGIPASVREHLFDPFYSGRQAGRGLGFGMCKARRIVELSGGTIDVRSDSEFPAVGTTIRMVWARDKMRAKGSEDVVKTAKTVVGMDTAEGMDTASAANTVSMVDTANTANAVGVANAADVESVVDTVDVANTKDWMVLPQTSTEEIR